VAVVVATVVVVVVGGSVVVEGGSVGMVVVATVTGETDAATDGAVETDGRDDVGATVGVAPALHAAVTTVTTRNSLVLTCLPPPARYCRWPAAWWHAMTPRGRFRQTAGQ
jgi:hypothetical protein